MFVSMCVADKNSIMVLYEMKV